MENQQVPQQAPPPAPIAAQPSAIPSMDPAMNPVAPHAVGGQPTNWSTGLFDCAFPDFCLSYCCPCIVYGQNKIRYDSLVQGRALRPNEVEPFGTASVVYLALHCVTGCGWILDFMQRGAIRQRYNILGDAGTDCLTSCCCLPCNQQQQARELTKEEELQWGAFATATTTTGGNNVSAIPMQEQPHQQVDPIVAEKV